MNFFEQQHRARKNTKYLVILFGLAVTGIVLAVTALVTVVIAYNQTNHEYGYQPPPKENIFLTTALWVAPISVLVIALVSWFRILQLGGSGAKVAEFMGGEPLALQGDDVKDLQLRNVVEEMSIASGVPVPEIYVLRNESGINAFAAGLEPSNAVVGVTQGTLDALSRDELQGVIAHEFSHIFNGDMRMNMNLMGLLAGIMFITTSGRVILETMGRGRVRSSSSKKNDGLAAILLIGVGLLVIGSIGAFFARWIKAAVSRQREFLADASAVQFTRNPNGIGGALSRIRDSYSTVSAGGAEEASHLFFGSIKNFAMFATHPPIEERIRRIGSVQFDDKLKGRISSEQAVSRVGMPKGEDFFKAVTILQGLSQETRSSLRKPKLSVEMILGVLAKDSGNSKVLAKLDPAIQKAVRDVPPDQALALVDLAMPAIRQLDPMYASNFLMAVETMIQEDGKIQPLEIAVLAILRRQMSIKTRGASIGISQALNEAVEILKLMARAGSSVESVAQQAFAAGAEKIGFVPDQISKFWSQPAMESLKVVQALTRLSALEPKQKAKFFEAIWVTANFDQKLTAAESQYLRAISEALEIPLPAAIA